MPPPKPGRTRSGSGQRGHAGQSRTLAEDRRRARRPSRHGPCRRRRHDHRSRGDHGRRRAWGPTARFDIQAPAAFARFIAKRARFASTARRSRSTPSRAMSSRSCSFRTPFGHHLGRAPAGRQLNLEVDLMARYAARLAEAGAGGREPAYPPTASPSRTPVHLGIRPLSECGTIRRDEPAALLRMRSAKPKRSFHGRNARQDHCPPARGGSTRPRRRGALL